MSRDYEPVRGQWYQNLEEEEQFRAQVRPDRWPVDWVATKCRVEKRDDALLRHLEGSKDVASLRIGGDLRVDDRAPDIRALLRVWQEQVRLSSIH